MSGPKIHTYGGKCLGTCGRILRSSAQSAAQNPGTNQHYSGGCCEPCFRVLNDMPKKPGGHPIIPMPLSYYTPEQTKRVTLFFGRDHEVMRMLGLAS